MKETRTSPLPALDGQEAQGNGSRRTSGSSGELLGAWQSGPWAREMLELGVACLTHQRRQVGLLQGMPGEAWAAVT
jgi:hypothetical protein